MSTIGDLHAAAKTRANTAKAQIDSIIAAEGIGADLKGVSVAIQYSVTVQQAPGSGLTAQQAADLAETYGWEIYVPA